MVNDRFARWQVGLIEAMPQAFDYIGSIFKRPDGRSRSIGTTVHWYL
jgi:hypothetical protein